MLSFFGNIPQRVVSAQSAVFTEHLPLVVLGGKAVILVGKRTDWIGFE